MVTDSIKKSLALLLVCFVGTSFAHPRVHIFGDSHAYHCFSDHYTNEYLFHYKERFVPFVVHYVGPRTMYRVGREGIRELCMRRYGVTEGDIALFIFGEVDVRCHIGKQCDQQVIPLDTMLTGLVAPYIKTILDNRALYTQCTCLVMEVMPPTDQAANPEYPRYGSLEERVCITRELNKKLKAACQQYGILFLEVHDLYADEAGILKAHLSDGNVHVSMEYNYLVKQKLIDLCFKG